MKEFDPVEQIIIERSSTVRNRTLDLWQPAKGIINIFENKHFEDPQGLLPLSVRQMTNLLEWTKYADTVPSDQYVNNVVDVATQINGYEVVQKNVSDCSVLSSLAVCGHFEFKHKHQRRIITQNIFPQDNSGNPIYNPTGEYVVKLFVNGIWRGVRIDDYVPINKEGDYLCAYSSRGKMWVSLIEKAYLKIHGGYDFNGSNSGRDLYVLTGWLPSKVNLKRENLNRDRLWHRISTGVRNNDCLITLGTGVIPD